MGVFVPCFFLQNIVLDCNASASHIPISLVNLGLFEVLVNQFQFLFLCIVHSRLILFGKSLVRKSNGPSTVP